MFGRIFTFFLLVNCFIYVYPTSWDGIKLTPTYEIGPIRIEEILALKEPRSSQRSTAYPSSYGSISGALKAQQHLIRTLLRDGKLDFLDVKFLENNLKESTRDYLESKGVIFINVDGVEKIDVEKCRESLQQIWLLIEFGQMARQQLVYKGIANPFQDLSESQILDTIKSLSSSGLHYRHSLWLFVNLAERLEFFMAYYGIQNPNF